MLISTVKTIVPYIPADMYCDLFLYMGIMRLFAENWWSYDLYTLLSRIAQTTEEHSQSICADRTIIWTIIAR